MNKKTKRFQKIMIVVVSWIFGNIAGIILALACMLGIVRIEQCGRGLDKKKLKRMIADSGKGVLMISNHPSGWETVALPALFWPDFLFSWRSMPVSTPKASLYNAKWFLIKPVCISVIRDDPRAGVDFINAIASALKEKRMVVLFAEGGRTYHGEDLKWRRFKKIRRFKKGVEGILKRGNPLIIMSWVEQNTIRFGEPFVYSGESIECLEDKLLDLSEVDDG